MNIVIKKKINHFQKFFLIREVKINSRNNAVMRKKIPKFLITKDIFLKNLF